MGPSCRQALAFYSASVARPSPVTGQHGGRIGEERPSDGGKHSAALMKACVCVCVLGMCAWRHICLSVPAPGDRRRRASAARSAWQRSHSLLSVACPNPQPSAAPSGIRGTYERSARRVRGYLSSSATAETTYVPAVVALSDGIRARDRPPRGSVTKDDNHTAKKFPSFGWGHWSFQFKCAVKDAPVENAG